MSASGHSIPWPEATGPPPGARETLVLPKWLDVRIAAETAALAEAKAVADAARAEKKAAADAQRAEAQAVADAERASAATYYAAQYEVGKGVLERRAASVDLVQKGAATVITLYTALLALVFKADGRTLPSRGLIPAILLGAAVVFSTVYVAYLRPPDEVAPDFDDDPEGRLASFSWSVSTLALRRAEWLRWSILSLGLAFAFLPAPFVGGRDWLWWTTGIVAAVGAGLIAFGEPNIERRRGLSEWVRTRSRRRRAPG